MNAQILPNPMKAVTIILPVYNGVRFTRLCLEALGAHTAAADYRLIVIDDCSDRYTADFLREAVQGFADHTWLRNEENLGFLRTCNRAWRQCDTPFVLLLNSDVLVTPEWLPRLLRCAAQDPSIASVNPLTNHAANIDLPLPQGCNHLGLDRILAKRQACCHDVVTGVGFCMLLRREAVGENIFDEVYGKGYCEESDLCMRLTSTGWRTVCAENVFVHHRGHGSFADTNARYLNNRRIFDSRWADEYQRQFHAFKIRDPLQPVRNEFSHPRQVWPRRYIRETWQAVRGQLHADNLNSALRTTLSAILHPARSLYPTVDTSLVQRCSRTGGPVSDLCDAKPEPVRHCALGGATGQRVDPPWD